MTEPFATTLAEAAQRARTAKRARILIQCGQLACSLGYAMLSALLEDAERKFAPPPPPVRPALELVPDLPPPDELAEVPDGA